MVGDGEKGRSGGGGGGEGIIDAVRVSSPIYLTNRFHFAVRLYSDKAYTTSEGGENKEVRHEPQASSGTDVLTTISRPPCVIRVQTHDKMNL